MTTLPVELWTLDFSIEGSNPMCDTVLTMFFFVVFFKYKHFKTVEPSGEVVLFYNNSSLNLHEFYLM